MFVKTFADIILGEIAPVAANVTIVVLLRDWRDVVWSQMRLGWFASGHSGRDVWYYDVDDVHASEAVLERGFGGEDGAEDGDDRWRVAKLCAYNADVYARTKALEAHVAREQRDGRLLNVDFAQYYLPRVREREGAVQEYARFLSSIGFEPDMGRLAVLGAQDANERAQTKGRAPASRIQRAHSDALVLNLMGHIADVAF